MSDVLAGSQKKGCLLAKGWEGTTWQAIVFLYLAVSQMSLPGLRAVSSGHVKDPWHPSLSQHYTTQRKLPARKRMLTCPTEQIGNQVDLGRRAVSRAEGEAGLGHCHFF